MFSLTGKTALVTGSTQGIGFEIAKALSEHGTRVFVHGATSIEKSRAAAEKIKNAEPICVNLNSPDAAKKLYAQTGDVDILVLNASVQYRTPWDEISDGEFDSQININLRSSLYAMQLYAKSMKEKKNGRILTIGSVQQYKPHKDMAVYAATYVILRLCRRISPTRQRLSRHPERSVSGVEPERSEGTRKGGISSLNGCF